MPVTVGKYCSNCDNRFICKLTERVKEFDRTVEAFNEANKAEGLTIVNVDYICRWKDTDGDGK